MSNRLLHEESPYLKQHAFNLVDWYPWGQEALNRAKKEDKPIFLSIGYSSCHWCHVMERESFENEEIAKELNEHFICIKVDKEERPDIDKHFQEIYIKMNNKAGGWPLSIFMTPDLVPIYSATYIPPIPNYGMMGFKDLIKLLAKSYKEKKEQLIQKGQEVLEALKPKSKIEATKINDFIIQNSITQIKQVFNKTYGGFGNAPKFPHSYTLNLTCNLYKLTKDEELKHIVEFTLDNMLRGGMYDIVEGGFCRYSTDEEFFIPHFEKMTYDNALMSVTLLKAYQITSKDIYKQKAFEILDFMLKKMSQDGLFFSASDADTNGVEGEYFIYKYDEVANAFREKAIDTSLLGVLNIYKNGRFDGKNIARVDDINELEKKETKEALEVLKSLRDKREYPFIDKKIITSWNAMMIDALFFASKFESKYKQVAINSLAALEKLMGEGVFIYHSTLYGNKPKIKGFLEDYAWMIKAYLSAYEVTLDELHLIKATDLANEAIKRFYDMGRWKIGDGEFQNYVEFTDSTYPSSASIMVQNLLSIRSLVESVYEKFAFNSLQVASFNLMRQPISHPTLANEAIRYLKDDVIIKSVEENLKPLLKHNFKYPYTLLKLASNETIEVCNNKACFASYKNVEEAKRDL